MSLRITAVLLWMLGFLTFYYGHGRNPNKTLPIILFLLAIFYSWIGFMNLKVNKLIIFSTFLLIPISIIYILFFIAFGNVLFL